ncbi:hypothetical protein [Rhizobium sp. BK251]|nr:hypothetical protein [Rhizobium sp. BK251]
MDEVLVRAFSVGLNAVFAGDKAKRYRRRFLIGAKMIEARREHRN